MGNLAGSFSRSSSSRSSSVGCRGGVAARAPRGSSGFGDRTFSNAADFALGSLGSVFSESPGGTGAFISGWGRADMALKGLGKISVSICYKYDLFSQVSIVCNAVPDEGF